MTDEKITTGDESRPSPPATFTTRAHALLWTRSERGYSLYTTIDGAHVSIYRRPNSGLRFKIDGALPPDLSVTGGQAFVLALLAGRLAAAQEGDGR